VVLLLPAALTSILLSATVWLARRRDIGTGMFSVGDRASPNFRLLSSPLALALRTDTGVLVGWTVAIGAFAFILGVVSKSVASAGIPRRLTHQFSKLGVGSIATAEGYVGLVFLIFAVALAAFAISQTVLARHEEEAERLETMLALPIARRRWLSGRLALTLGGAVAIALVAALLAWLGGRAAGVSISTPAMLGAAANCVAMAILFGGIAALTFALLPRATAILPYALLTLAFLWQLFGQLFGAPRWLTDLTPFAHLGLAPGQPFRLVPVLVLAAIGAAAASLALGGFQRRDLVGP
jgi:ABC-2 type transport system permease protein